MPQRAPEYVAVIASHHFMRFNQMHNVINAAFIMAMLSAILVALRPQWVAGIPLYKIVVGAGVWVVLVQPALLVAAFSLTQGGASENADFVTSMLHSWLAISTTIAVSIIGNILFCAAYLALAIRLWRKKIA
jgi:hypothetical protein